MTTPFGKTASVRQIKFGENLRTEYVCARCDATYCELENMGAWRCTAYHPMVRANAQSVYECCGSPYLTAGCVKADHTTGEHNRMARAQSELETPINSEEALFMASLLDCPLDALKTRAWRFDDRTKQWRVCRVDWGARTQAMHKQYRQ